MDDDKKNLLERFSYLFRGLTRAHGIYELLENPVGGKKVQGKARTVQGEVTVQNWERHFKGHLKHGLGIVPLNDEGISYFGAIDVDRYDLSLAAVERDCARLKLPLLPTRTKSAGCHLYIFTKGVPAGLLKSTLEHWSVALGFGGSEVFPKQAELISQGDTGNWINMPYFGIWGENQATERYGVFMGDRLSLEAYCDRAEALTIDEATLTSIHIKEDAKFEEGPPCLQSIAKKGFGEGMRNNGLTAVGIYLKKRFPDRWEEQLYSYNTKFFKPPLKEAEVKTVIKSLGRKEYNYSCDRQPLITFCNRNICKTRKFGVGASDTGMDLIFDTGNALKVMTDPPYWIVNVNGVRTELQAEDLLSQTQFARTALIKLNRTLGKMSTGRWHALVQSLLDSAQEVEAPIEATPGGELADHLFQFCTNYASAETREEILTGKPFTEEGFVYFRAADFKKYLEAQHFRSLTGHRLFAKLKELGMTHKAFRVGDSVIRVWVMPEFKPIEVDIPPKKLNEGSM